MRIALAAVTAALLGLATAASAAPAQVNVTIGAEMQKKAEKTYGVRDVGEAATILRDVVSRRLARIRAYDDARLDLVLTDVKPNRPTFFQLGQTPGLSFQSFGVGGAAIEGQVVRADGTTTPIVFRWYENDIRWAEGHTTWHDAEWAFSRLATKLARGDQLAAR